MKKTTAAKATSLIAMNTERKKKSELEHVSQFRIDRIWWASGDVSGNFSTQSNSFNHSISDFVKGFVGLVSLAIQLITEFPLKVDVSRLRNSSTSDNNEDEEELNKADETNVKKSFTSGANNNS